MELVILPILSLSGCSRVTTVTLEWVGYVPLDVLIIDWAMIISFTIASFPDLLASFPDLLASFPDLLASFPDLLASFPDLLASFQDL